MTIVYQCDNCKEVHSDSEWIVKCLGCKKEICETCMGGWHHCRGCAGKTSEDKMAKKFKELRDKSAII
jgi:hypothetical protein